MPRQITAGEGKHGISRQPAIASDKFPCSPKKTTHKKGFVRNHLAFFKLIFESKKVQKIIGTEGNKMFYCLKYLAFPLFQVTVTISVFCNHFINHFLQT